MIIISLSINRNGKIFYKWIDYSRDVPGALLCCDLVNGTTHFRQCTGSFLGEKHVNINIFSLTGR